MTAAKTFGLLLFSAAMAAVVPAAVAIARPQSAPLRRPDVRFLSTPDNVVDAMLELAQVAPASTLIALQWETVGCPMRRETSTDWRSISGECRGATPNR